MEKMDKKIKKQWVKNLRSGEFKQTVGCLSEVVDGERQHCCLGVLCETTKFNYRGYKEFPSQIVLNKAGLPLDRAVHLANLNDDGKSFKYIAYYIDRYL